MTKKNKIPSIDALNKYHKNIIFFIKAQFRKSQYYTLMVINQE